jgi:protein-S-isoprenylcysteine O-methyltransferase Ste14
MRWKNVPIPETIVVPLALGFGLDLFFSKQLFPLNSLWVALSIALFLFGISVIVWSVRVAGRHDLTAPDELITGGPYAFSRNPMYVAWISIYLSILCFNQSIWLAMLFPVSVLLTHFLAVMPEERMLMSQFGEKFSNYCQHVRRYF